MASAVVRVLPDNFIDYSSSDLPAYGWLSPTMSFSTKKKNVSDPANDHGDFEFTTEEVLSIADDEPCAFSPKAPRCSSRWIEFLGLRKNKSTSSSNSSSTKTGSSIRQFLHRTSKSMSAFSASDASLRLPLLKESDCESISVASSRFSLSSSSSGHDHDDFPRFSLDCDNRPSRLHLSTNQSLNQPRVRMVKPRMVPISAAEDPKPLIDHPSAPLTANRTMPRTQQDSAAITSRLSMDSPRMISSGKIVFESLERSSSTPSIINGGGPRYRNKAVERSYSANVRITPVLNVPICSLRGSSKSGVLGFGQLFSSQSKKKEANGGSSNSNYHQIHQHYSSRVKKTSS